MKEKLTRVGGPLTLPAMSRLKLALALCLTAFTVHADEPKAPPAKKEEPKKEEKKDDKKSEAATSTGSVTIGGKAINYKATAATLPILRPDGKPSASVFYTSYVIEGAKEAERPVTF